MAKKLQARVAGKSKPAQTTTQRMSIGKIEVYRDVQPHVATDLNGGH
jgi:hypothetical protein